MCVDIFSGKRKKRLYEAGIDVLAKTEGDASDVNYFGKIVVQTHVSLGGLHLHFEAMKCHA